ncbi:hypothetical protein [Hyalangium versicolor]|uniref:hypothetical protein n=1 Tax=Hyalangium versicolor TaxID=2861190 RepID=UPI001CCCB853|nr:hypothetical protein [Hyalangium versicolor]
MRQSWKNALLWMLSVGLVSACGGTPETEPRTALGERRQAVLAPPPAPASGNIYDSTTYVGPVAVGGSAQAAFTADPQYFSFKVQVPANSQLKLEVTHLGSSMSLDTGLFLYGPKDANGSYGTTPLAVDDDAGYGTLSRITLVTLAQGGEYLAVVSSPNGTGKQFRLQVDCMGFACVPQPPPAAPADYHLVLVEEPVTAQLQALVDSGNTRDGAFANLHRYDFGWPYAGEASLAQATAEALDMVGEWWRYEYYGTTEVFTYAQFTSAVYSFYQPLPATLLSTYGNGTENVQVRRYYRTYQTGPNGDHWDNLFIILFPESHKVIVFEEQAYEI